jgi:hypothetical protein
MLESSYRSYSLAVNEQIYKHSIKVIVYLAEDSIVINLNQIIIAALSSKSYIFCTIVCQSYENSHLHLSWQAATGLFQFLAVVNKQ